MSTICSICTGMHVTNISNPGLQGQDYRTATAIATTRPMAEPLVLRLPEPFSFLLLLGDAVGLDDGVAELSWKMGFDVLDVISVLVDVGAEDEGEDEGASMLLSVPNFFMMHCDMSLLSV